MGENSLDRVCTVDGPPRFPAKALLLDERELPGGQVATAALACARLGLRTAYVGAVGEDREGELALAPLARAGVDLSGVKRVRGAASRRALVLVDRRSGERSILERRDPTLRIGPADLDRARIAAARLVLLDASQPELAHWITDVTRDARIPVVLDVDRGGPGLLELTRRCDFPIVSREFAEEISEDGSTRGGLRRVAGPRTRWAVATLGAQGAVAWSGSRWIESPGLAVPVVDTTGAGDAFRGGFAWALLEGASVTRALRIANATAALSCRALGAQGALPTREEVLAALAQQAGAGGER